MTPDQLAQLAKSLVDNEAFQGALEMQRRNALERLANMRHEQREEFYAAQAIVAVVDGIRSDLDAFVRAGTPPKQAGIA